MMTVEAWIDVPATSQAAWAHWARCDELPAFLEGVAHVEPLDEQRWRWLTRIGGVEHGWDTVIVRRDAGRDLAWRTEDGPYEDCSLLFEELDEGYTRVTWRITVDSQGSRGQTLALLGLLRRRMRADLRRFRALVQGSVRDAPRPRDLSHVDLFLSQSYRH